MFLTAAVYDFTFDLEFHRRVPVTGYVVSSAERRRALKLVDRALSKRQYKSAVSLVKQLQGKPYGLRGFGAAKQIIKRRLELDESEVNGMDMLSLQPLVDSILDSVQQCLQISFLEEAHSLFEIFSTFDVIDDKSISVSRTTFSLLKSQRVQWLKVDILQDVKNKNTSFVLNMKLGIFLLDI
uniref:Uncharacterized protein n=1 Tax=Cucumis melo TaxID=3656 RepID=A0A9I9E679_CUCME